MNAATTVSAALILATIIGGTISSASAKSLPGVHQGAMPAKTSYTAKEIPRSFMMGAMRAAAIGGGGRSGIAGAANGAGKGRQVCPPLSGVCVTLP